MSLRADSNTAQHFCHWKLKICKLIYQIHTKGWIPEITETHLFECDTGLYARRGKNVVSFERPQISDVTYRISGDVSASSPVFYIVCAEVAIDVQDSVGTTRA